MENFGKVRIFLEFFGKVRDFLRNVYHRENIWPQKEQKLTADYPI
jgi:hypothetical protein